MSLALICQHLIVSRNNLYKNISIYTDRQAKDKSLSLPHTNQLSLMSHKIDFQLASSILDRLELDLQDLSLDYGDVVIPNGDISHQLWFDSMDNPCTLLGYVWLENGIYYTSTSPDNHATPQQAALDLLDSEMVRDCAFNIELERLMAKDYV